MQHKFLDCDYLINIIEKEDLEKAELLASSLESLDIQSEKTAISFIILNQGDMI